MKAFTKALLVYQLHAALAQLRGGKSNNEDRELGVFDSNTRIIGGAEASRGRYSYAVSLSDRIGHFCGGSLICPDVVLTAAHCQGGEYDAIIGRHDLRSNDGEEISVKTELPHPSYDPHTTDNDFMLVFLDRETNESVDFVKVRTIHLFIVYLTYSICLSYESNNISLSIPDISRRCGSIYISHCHGLG